MNRINKNQKKLSNQEELKQVLIDLARVTRVTTGGKRLRFRAGVAVGDKNGRVGMAVAKGADVALAINKAVTKAKKRLIEVPIINETIPHQIQEKFKAAKVLIKPAPKGTGVIAGGSVRIILDLAGVKNVVAKILGSKNKINNAKATIEALKSLKWIPELVKKKEEKQEQKEKKSDNLKLTKTTKIKK